METFENTYWKPAAFSLSTIKRLKIVVSTEEGECRLREILKQVFHTLVSFNKLLFLVSLSFLPNVVSEVIFAYACHFVDVGQLAFLDYILAPYQAENLSYLEAYALKVRELETEGKVFELDENKFIVSWIHERKTKRNYLRLLCLLHSLGYDEKLQKGWHPDTLGHWTMITKMLNGSRLQKHELRTSDFNLRMFTLVLTHITSQIEEKKEKKEQELHWVVTERRNLQLEKKSLLRGSRNLPIVSLVNEVARFWILDHFDVLEDHPLLQSKDVTFWCKGTPGEGENWPPSTYSRKGYFYIKFNWN